MTDTTMAERIDKLTTAVIALARIQGTRLTRVDMCERFGVCGKTLTELVKRGEAPEPFLDGRWLLWRVLEWDMEHAAEPSKEEAVDDGATDEPGFHLYRHFDAAGTLLYVGVSLSALGRLAGHSCASHWFKQIARVEITNWVTREASLRAERRAIRLEKPLYNIQHALRLAA